MDELRFPVVRFSSLRVIMGAEARQPTHRIDSDSDLGQATSFGELQLQEDSTPGVHLEWKQGPANIYKS